VTDIAGTYSVNVPASTIQSETDPVLPTLPSTAVGELSVAADIPLFNESLPDLSYYQPFPSTASPVVVSSVSTAPTPTVTQSVNMYVRTHHLRQVVELPMLFSQQLCHLQLPPVFQLVWKVCLSKVKCQNWK